MSVAESSADVCAPTTADYGRTLRAIGQDLSELYPKTFEIDTDGVNFIVRGRSHPNPFKHQLKRGTLAWFWRALRAKSLDLEMKAGEPIELDFERSYTPDAIDSLVQSYSAKRTGQLSRPDNYSLGERMRTLGGIVKSRQGRLKQVRKDGDRLFADYWNEKGEVDTAKLTTVILYRNQQQSAEGPALQELWEGYDF